MRTLLSFAILTPIMLCADANDTVLLSEIPYDAWNTGTFLAPTSVNMEKGHPMLQPAIAVFNFYGRYNSDWKVKRTDSIWTINPSIDFQFALTKRTGIELATSLFTSIKDGKSYTHIVDSSIFFGYQISTEQKDSWVPNFRILFQTIFSLGKYDRLDPKKEGIDLSGQGAFFFGPTLAFSKSFKIPRTLFVYWSLGYLFPTEVHVKGFNLYGGGFGTKGRLHPGQVLNAILSLEYSLTQNWVIGFDSAFYYQRPCAHFKGEPGVLPNGKVAKVGNGVSVLFSVAPQIEYNFSAKSGISFGTWWTVAGRNNRAFGSVFLSYLYIF